jgi:hypothetical protein
VKFRTIAVLFTLAYGFSPTFAAIAAAPVDTSPPPGIAPASISLAALLSHNKFAAGRVDPGTPRTRVEHWTLAYGSLTGTRDEWHNGTDYRVTEVLGPDTESYGVSGGRHWQQNANGQITFENGLHERDATDNAALRDASSAGVTLLGHTASPVDAYVVKVDPPGGRLEYVFYDAKTWLIDRVEAVRDGRRTTTTLADYRLTKGLKEPWHVHWTDGFATNDGDEIMQSLAIGDPVAAAQTSVPAPGPPLFAAPSTLTAIPATIEDDRIVIAAKLGGHSVHFLMDSGADGIVIDRDIVDAVGIKRYGKMTGETAGAYAESSAVIPEFAVGSLSLHNVHVRALPFVQYAADGKPVAGLLGYDFICNAVWHVDYQHGTVEVIDPQAFVPPAGAKALSVRFDDRVPAVAASLANAAVPAFIVDTGADRSALFSSFLQTGGKNISDRGLGTSMRAAWPFVDDMEGVGGSVDYRPLQAGPLALGAWSFPKWLFYVTQNAPAFEFEDYDGLIGQDLLRNFDLYLDYAHSKLYLVPNDRFRQRWNT